MIDFDHPVLLANLHLWLYVLETHREKISYY